MLTHACVCGDRAELTQTAGSATSGSASSGTGAGCAPVVRYGRACVNIGNDLQPLDPVPCPLLQLPGRGALRLLSRGPGLVWCHLRHTKALLLVPVAGHAPRWQVLRCVLYAHVLLCGSTMCLQLKLSFPFQLLVFRVCFLREIYLHRRV